MSKSKLSHGPRRIEGAAIPLFERLLAPGAGRPTHDRETLRAAIAASLQDLFSVRARREAADLPAAQRTVIDYGIPELDTVRPQRAQDRTALAKALLEAIRAFEPRLIDPEIGLGDYDPQTRSLGVEIAGLIRLDKVLEPFTLVIPLQFRGTGAGHAA